MRRSQRIRFLPVSEEQRKPWKTPEVPRGLRAACSDSVSYEAQRENDDTPQSYVRSPCYSRLSKKYNKYSILCRPLQRPGAVSLEDAYTFFNAFTQHDVIPEGIQLWEEEPKGIFCQIPRGVGENYQLYVALSLYRWVDVIPALVWQFARLWEQEVDRHPFQILSYVLAKNDSRVAPVHTFLFCRPKRGPGYPFMLNTEPHKVTNPLVGLGAKIFFDQQDERGEKGRRDFEGGSGSIAYSIMSLVEGITSMVTKPNPYKKQPWLPDRKASPRFLLREEEDVLHPALKRLYEVPGITKDQVREICEDLFTEKE